MIILSIQSFILFLIPPLFPSGGGVTEKSRDWNKPGKCSILPETKAPPCLPFLVCRKGFSILDFLCVPNSRLKELPIREVRECRNKGKTVKQGRLNNQFSSVQLLSRVRLFVTPWIVARQASLSITNSRSSLKLCPSSQWCHPTISSSVVPFSSCPQSLPAWVFSNESTLLMRWPKYWSFSSSISPSKEHPGLISFRMDWLDVLAVQGTLKSLLQHHSSKASILRHSAFFTVQLSHPHMTTGKP